ncbi:hypothetical protein FCV25MIE_25441 [Fagus crenata]
MASINCTGSDDDDQKVRKAVVIQRRPLMLKDYLRDDLSSCSSNGFNSFPRRQCCTSSTVRFLLELDLKLRDHSTTINTTRQRLFRRRRRSERSKLTATAASTTTTTTTISALQRASEAVINAVKKQLPFHSVKSPSVQIRARKGLSLTRSLSRKLFRKSFWNLKKADKEEEEEEKSDIRRWRLFREILNDQNEPSDQNTHRSSLTSSNSKSWEESEFTSENLRCSSGNSESSSTSNDVVESKTDLPVKKVSKRVGVTVGEDSMLEATNNTYSGTNTKEWPNEEKEQFSPVSVLDSPFEDDEEISSPFESSLACIEGTKQKPMHKTRRIECLAQLEPLDLEKRIALSEFNHEAPQSPMLPYCSLSTQDNNTFNKKEVNQTEQLKAQELLDLIRTKSSPSTGVKFKVDNLLLDFIRERIEEINNANASTRRRCDNEFQHELLKVTEDWFSGQPQELLLGWEVQDGRKVYVKDMEKGGKWSILVEEKEEVALEVEIEVLNTLLSELLLDLF